MSSAGPGSQFVELVISGTILTVFIQPQSICLISTSQPSLDPFKVRDGVFLSSEATFLQNVHSHQNLEIILGSGLLQRMQRGSQSRQRRRERIPRKKILS